MPHRGRKSAAWVPIAAAVAGVALSSGSAHAATITDTGQIPQVADFPGVGVDVFLPQFDPALGTLTGVSAILTGQFTPGIALSSFPPPPLPPVSFHPEIEFERITQHLGVQSVPVDGSLEVFGIPEAVDITTALPVAGAVGLGRIDFYITGDSGTSYGHYEDFDAGTLSGQVAVTYTFTPGIAVPEPAGLALMGSGLLGLCAVRPRVRRSVSS